MSLPTWTPAQTIILGAVSLFFLAFTLLRPHRHRIPRFFSFECVLLLVLVNTPAWFRDPFLPRQVFSWIFLAASIYLVIHGFVSLVRLGLPEQDIENTSVLVKTGPYRYIRHPLYASLLVGGFGALLKDISWVSVLLFVLLTVSLTMTAKVEEKENIERFGEAYRDYMGETRMFIPFLF